MDNKQKRETFKSAINTLIDLVLPDGPIPMQAKQIPRVFCEHIQKCFDFPEKCATCAKNEMANCYEKYGERD